MISKRSLIIALIITCLEWTGVQFDQVNDQKIYYEIFQTIHSKTDSKDLYLSYLSRNISQSSIQYPCITDFLNITSLSNQVKRTSLT